MRREFTEKIIEFLVILVLMITTVGGAGAAQTDIAGPAGSGRFGENVVVLPNGNIVVVDSLYDEGGVTDIGAVYLYDGATLAIISTLKGSSINDNVGKESFIGARDGVIILANGNFVVRSPAWDNGVANTGAVTFCSQTTGCNGVVSSSNSLIGGTAGDEVGYNQGSFRAILTLPNGNYVVSTPAWDNGAAADAGAVTFCSGATGCAGLLTLGNSLVGGTTNDAIGFFNGLGATALTNGNYVVGSKDWDNPAGAVQDVGAVTWCSGTTGCAVGLITPTNSLIGGTAFDNVGSDITTLTNGNYAVNSPFWSNPAGPILGVGAVTWGNGAGGTVGLVTVGNSLYGGTSGDAVGFNGVIALTNGNYVALHPFWDNPAGAVNVGAIIWGNGAGGTEGLVSAANPLTGGTANDQIGSNGIFALTNGNYVVFSMFWDNPAGAIANVGAATWGNGTGGTTGVVAPGNSLVGTTTFDLLYNYGVTPLTNGNYVVNFPGWDNGAATDVGAATWGSGAGGTVGAISPTNSLVGGTAFDNIGGPVDGVVALTNGNYLVRSRAWHTPLQNPLTAGVGAVTWRNGAGGTTGLVTVCNSLVGGTSGDAERAAMRSARLLPAAAHWHFRTATMSCRATVGTIPSVTFLTPEPRLSATGRAARLDWFRPRTAFPAR